MLTLKSMSQIQPALAKTKINAYYQLNNPRLLTTDQSTQELRGIKSTLQSSLQIPVDSTDAASIYKLTQSWIVNDFIIFH